MLIQASLKVMPHSFKGREEDYALVDEALLMIQNSGLKHIIGCSETTIEGENEEVLNLIKEIQNHYHNKGINFIFLITIESNSESFYIEDKKESISKIKGE